MISSAAEHSFVDGTGFQDGILHPTIADGMRISKASIASGVSTGMIRRYERMGLMPPTRRLENGYRDYTSDDVMRLRFILTFNELGFPLNEIGDLLSPWDGDHRGKKELQRLARSKAQELGRRAQILLAAAKAWNELAEYSSGSDSPMDPIRVIATLNSLK